MGNISPIQKIHIDKYLNPKGPKKSESMPNCYTKLSQESKHTAQPLETHNLISAQPFEDQNESLITINSVENTSLSRNESKDDLRKYVKMVSKIAI